MSLYCSANKGAKVIWTMFISVSIFEQDLCRVRIQLDSNLEDSIKLELRRGDILTALEEEEGGNYRWKGELSNMIGEFPVEVMEESGEHSEVMRKCLC